MKFIIEGREYDVEQGVRKASLATLYELKVRHGIGVKTLQEYCRELAKYDDPIDLIEDKVGLQALRVIVWLTRKGAGDKVTSLDDATAFSLDDFEIVLDDDEAAAVAEDELDPKATVVSAPVASAGATP